MLIRWRLPWDAPNAIEAKQTEFRAEPEIPSGVWAIALMMPLKKPSRTVHAVCAY
jgi:hypothetical protein